MVLSLTLIRMLPVAVAMIGTSSRPDRGLRGLVRAAGPGIDRFR